MKKLSVEDIRQRFLEYFKNQDHEIVGSSGLIPNNDPTLLFTNAGMVQFKDYFLAPSSAPHKRVATVQKCLRVGGKHNDLENVGYTARHHTFFEMLGNFSFGDYFKREAIEFAWNFLRNVLGLDESKMYVTVFRDDDEAADIWRNDIGLDTSRILRFDEKDNFWSMGDTGPCGPCSEILYDQGPELGDDDDFECDRYLEIWNLVFMQFNQSIDGQKSRLPDPCIDTGMGLERIAAIVQGVQTNYATDLFKALIHTISSELSAKYETDTHASFNVIADHLRAASFLIAEGIVPTNEGRGYVLRRILRRAMRHARILNSSKPILHTSVPAVVDEMGSYYPELVRERERIVQAIRHEEDQFIAVLERGMKHLSDEVGKVKDTKESVFPGEVAFHLYETYGFPVDLTEDILRGEALSLNFSAFEKAAEEHRRKARGSWTGSALDGTTKQIEESIRTNGLESTFVGYEMLCTTSSILAIFDADGHSVEESTSVPKDSRVYVVCAETPFYAESGGQVGDSGFLRLKNGQRIPVVDTQKFSDVHTHCIDNPRKTDQLTIGAKVELQVDQTRRQSIVRHHSLTHIMHAGLHQILGDHVRQAGSFLDESHLTFDFTHHAAMTPEQLKALEFFVNEKIWDNVPVTIETMSHDKAVAAGARAFFEEKYGDQVRVVSIGDFSMELCGGTHVQRTSEIGMARVLSEKSVAANTRRIELISGLDALKRYREDRESLENMAQQLKTNPADLHERLHDLMQQNRELRRAFQESQVKNADDLLRDLSESATTVNSFKVVSTSVPDISVEVLRQYADRLLDKLRSGVVALGTQQNDRATVIVKVSKDLTDRISADSIIKAICPFMDGRGGGRKEMAQGGSTSPNKLNDALIEVPKVIQGFS